MTDLTEQWKKGELPCGWYYIKGGDGGVYPAENCPNYDYINDKVDNQFYYAEDEIEEILESVPNYNKYLALKSDQLAKEEGAEIVAELQAENEKLKELLKRCKGLMNITKDWVCTEATETLITKIDEALKC